VSKKPFGYYFFRVIFLIRGAPRQGLRARRCHTPDYKIEGIVGLRVNLMIRGGGIGIVTTRGVTGLTRSSVGGLGLR